MKDVSLVIVIMMSCFSELAGQAIENKQPLKNTIHLQAGLEYGYFKDLNYSPMNYYSIGFSGSLNYSRNLHDDSRIYASGNIRIEELRSDITGLFPSWNYNYNLESGYQKRIPFEFSKTNIWVGGQFHSYFNLAYYNNDEAMTFLGLHSLGLIASITRKVSPGQSLTGTVTLPVIGLLIRPPWTGWDKFITESRYNTALFLFSGEWASLNNFFGLNWNIRYEWAISRKWGLAATYQFRYFRTDIPKTAIIQSNEFNIGTGLSF